MALRMTKTDFQNYRVCPAYGWTAQHCPQDVPPVSDPMRPWYTRFGDHVDALAQECFPGGMSIDAIDVDDAVEQTLNAIERGVRRIYQATFITDDGLLARADILDHRQDGWTLIEVKSGGHRPDDKDNTKYLWDAAFQREVIERVGLPVSHVSLLLINKEYVRGSTLVVEELMVEIEVTNQVDQLVDDLRNAIRIFSDQMLQPEQPSCECERKSKRNWCPIRTSIVDPKGTIYEIPYISGRQIEEFLDRGWTRLEQIEDLTPLNSRMVTGYRNLMLTETLIDVGILRTFLGSLNYPIHFIDYETIQFPVPIHRGSRPNTQEPFQFSLHVEDVDTSWHVEFLHDDPGTAHEPRWLAALQRSLGDLGSVVVWNAEFEAPRNRELADRHPEYATLLLGMNERMVDLMDVVTKGMYVSPHFRGTAKLKNVQPILAPEYSYAELLVRDGLEAQAAWLEAMQPETTREQRAKLLGALRTYCGYDTEVMVVIWKRLREIAGLR